MKSFVGRIGLFIVPPILFLSTVSYLDFFKIFGFQDYYASQVVGLNRGMITTSLFNEYREKEKFDSFIFGSSRSQAFKCENWVSYLGVKAKPFHFDGSGEGIWGISRKIQYIDELGDTLKNALVVLDRTVLSITYPREGHLYISMPCVSKSSTLAYYATFLKASLNPKFLTAYLDYAVFKTHRSYMGFLIKKSKYDLRTNPTNGDLWYGRDKEIEGDSAGYYAKLIEDDTFYKRPGTDRSPCNVTDEEKSQLLAIKNIFDKHQTTYKIIISPVYDQIPLETAQLELLEELFGKENIYNFSGPNKFTEPIANFYETSHYRPILANQLMKIIYADQSPAYL